jgi:2-dehydro-3-deoxyphosphogluconate aldolase/(4S)-4-hydroxy-2-oxoglutarate aldolase
LHDGGLTVLEVTLRTPVALQAIQQIRQALPDLFVGAGTVLDTRAAQDAHDAGAQFLVSPGYTTALGDYCRSKQIALMPGVATASEIMAALADGYDFLKCFPAAALGGTRWLDAMRGPFPDARFCPTGGISAADAGSYLSLSNVLCVGGSWVTPADAIRAKDWAHITALARQAYEVRASR